MKRSLVAVEVVGAVLAWRDLAQRPDSQVRGKKRLWRKFVFLNPGKLAHLLATGATLTPAAAMSVRPR